MGLLGNASQSPPRVAPTCVPHVTRDSRRACTGAGSRLPARQPLSWSAGSGSGRGETEAEAALWVAGAREACQQEVGGPPAWSPTQTRRCLSTEAEEDAGTGRGAGTQWAAGPSGSELLSPPQTNQNAAPPPPPPIAGPHRLVSIAFWTHHTGHTGRFSSSSSHTESREHKQATLTLWYILLNPRWLTC